MVKKMDRRPSTLRCPWILPNALRSLSLTSLEVQCGIVRQHQRPAGMFPLILPERADAVHKTWRLESFGVGELECQKLNFFHSGFGVELLGLDLTEFVCKKYSDAFF